jgi:hypothetical protein
VHSVLRGPEHMLHNTSQSKHWLSVLKYLSYYGQDKQLFAFSPLHVKHDESQNSQVFVVPF